MPIADNEVSIDSGQPIRNYEFARGPVTYRYTTANRDIVMDFKTFKRGYAVRDNGMQSTGEVDADDFRITISADAEIIGLYQVVAPSSEVYVTVWEYHYEDVDWLVAWTGTVESCRKVNQIEYEIVCKSIAAFLTKPGLRWAYSRMCTHTLYDTVGCKVNPELYAETGTMFFKDRQAIRVTEIDGYPADWFTGGFVRIQLSPGVYESRGIRRHVGDLLLLLGGSYGLPADSVCTVYAGCSRSLIVCDGKFLNKGNHGAQTYLPGKNIYSGVSIW